MVPYILVYQLIEPLLNKESISAPYVLIRVIMFFLCILTYKVLYCFGLKFSHEGAFNTLKNIRTYVQSRIEKMPLGNIQDIGTGQLKKVFTDDIDGTELLLAHAVPEGFSNLMGAAVMIIAMFFVDVRMALLSVAALGFSSSATGEMLFGVLNDVTCVWFPIFLGSVGVAIASFLYKKLI